MDGWRVCLKQRLHLITTSLTTVCDLSEYDAVVLYVTDFILRYLVVDVVGVSADVVVDVVGVVVDVYFC